MGVLIEVWMIRNGAPRNFKEYHDYSKRFSTQNPITFGKDVRTVHAMIPIHKYKFRIEMAMPANIECKAFADAKRVSNGTGPVGASRPMKYTPCKTQNNFSNSFAMNFSHWPTLSRGRLLMPSTAQLLSMLQASPIASWELPNRPWISLRVFFSLDRTPDKGMHFDLTSANWRWRPFGISRFILFSFLSGSPRNATSNERRNFPTWKRWGIDAINSYKMVGMFRYSAWTTSRFVYFDWRISSLQLTTQAPHGQTNNTRLKKLKFCPMWPFSVSGSMCSHRRPVASFALSQMKKHTNTHSFSNPLADHLPESIQFGDRAFITMGPIREIVEWNRTNARFGKIDERSQPEHSRRKKKTMGASFEPNRWWIFPKATLNPESKRFHCFSGKYFETTTSNGSSTRPIGYLGSHRQP